MSREVLMRIIDDFIDTSIIRLSSESGEMFSHFFLDLRDIFPDRQRITQNLMDLTCDTITSRGLIINDKIDNTSLRVTVDLNRCHFNSRQAVKFSEALKYVRQMHGLHL